jgi:transcriptional regulator with XRE-family HTH domain
VEKLPLGQVIKIERIKKNLKAIELAKKAGISKSYLSDIETARQDPSIKMLHKITSALGIKIEDVFAMSNFDEIGQNKIS